MWNNLLELFLCTLIRLNEGRDMEKFEDSMTKLLKSFASMMSHKTDKTDPILVTQGACLKYLPSTIPDILTVYSPVKLRYFEADSSSDWNLLRILISFFLFASSLLMELIGSLPSNRLTKQKMMTIDDIIHSPLFLIPECRRVLLAQILHLVKQLLENSDEVSNPIYTCDSEYYNDYDI